MKYGASANCGVVINVGFMQTSDGNVDPKRDLRSKHVSEISSQARGYGSAEAFFLLFCTEARVQHAKERAFSQRSQHKKSIETRFVM